MELNVEQLVPLVLVASPVTTLGDSGESAGLFVVFAQLLVEDHVEELSVASHACFLIASDSASFGI